MVLARRTLSGVPKVHPELDVKSFVTVNVRLMVVSRVRIHLPRVPYVQHGIVSLSDAR